MTKKHKISLGIGAIAAITLSTGLSVGLSIKTDSRNNNISMNQNKKTLIQNNERKQIKIQNKVMINEGVFEKMLENIIPVAKREGYLINKKVIMEDFKKHPKKYKNLISISQKYFEDLNSMSIDSANIYGETYNWWSRLWGKIKSTFEKIAVTVTTAVKTVVKVIKGVGEYIWEKITKIFDPQAFKKEIADLCEIVLKNVASEYVTKRLGIIFAEMIPGFAYSELFASVFMSAIETGQKIAGVLSKEKPKNRFSLEIEGTYENKKTTLYLS